MSYAFTRRKLKQYWPCLVVAVSALTALALHVIWYRIGASGGEVVSAYGAELVAISIAVVGAVLLTPGALDRATAGAMPQDPRNFHLKHDPEAGPRRNALIEDIRRGIIIERLAIGGIVLIGTLLNGYGPLVARVLCLRK